MLGKFGILRRDYLKENKPEVYAELEKSGELDKHLQEINDEATERKFRFIEQRKKSQGVDAKLQSENFPLYLQKLQTIETEVEQQIVEEMVYV